MKERPATTAYEFLVASLNAFNGSGYADMRSMDTFIASYLAYKQWKNPTLVNMAKENMMIVRDIVDILLENTKGAGRSPSKEKLKQFTEYYPPAEQYQTKLQ